jgi:tetratricopeptide (TPR) repeat protein
MDKTMTDYVMVLKAFLPKGAEILELQQPEKRPAILLADLDGDQCLELVGAYKDHGENYIVILKEYDHTWYQVAHTKGSGYNITDLLAAPVVDSTINTLIIGWQIGGIWSELDLLQWTTEGFQHLTPNKKIYSKMEVEDMKAVPGKDGKYEIALWQHDTGNAYQIDIFRWCTNGLVKATDVYPYYFKKAANYYKALIQEMDSPVYWYYLADAQMKAGSLDQALTTIHKALSSSTPYPSKEKLLEMKQQLQAENNMVVQVKRGDVTGDGTIDTVYLTADQTPDSPFWENITLVVRNGRTNQYEKTFLKENAGYNPTIFLGDFTGDKVEDIFIIINTSGGGGTIYAYMFSFINGKLLQIFDSEAFNEKYKYDVKYKDQYKAAVTSFNPQKKYTIDLMYKGDDYLAEIYNMDGTLKEPIEGWMSPLSGLYPVDFDRDGTYELNSFQNIAGRYNADGLGYMENVLKWNGREFASDRQNVAIFGEELNSVRLDLPNVKTRPSERLIDPMQ